MLEPACDPPAVDAARSLEFRDLITVNLVLKKRQVSADTWLYIQDQDIIFGRMHEPKNWSSAMVADDNHTSLVLECFCTEGDHIWTMSDRRSSVVVFRIREAQFYRSARVEEVLVIRTRDAYPVYDLVYQKNLAHWDESKYIGLHTDAAALRYNNADHSIEMGLRLQRCSATKWTI
jgi:protoporphyrinogen oxidase